MQAGRQIRERETETHKIQFSLKAYADFHSTNHMGGGHRGKGVGGWGQSVRLFLYFTVT